MILTLLETVHGIDHVLLATVATAGALLLLYLWPRHDTSSVPLINDREGIDLFYTKAKNRFVADAEGLIKAGFAKSRNIFRLITDNGTWVVIPPKWANEIRNDDRLNFRKVTAMEFHGNLPGFEPFRLNTPESDIGVEVIRGKLTQSLSLVTKPLSVETSAALEKNWTDEREWHNIYLKHTILQIIAQISSRVFLGEEICRNPDWQRITINYTIDSFLAAQSLRMWPPVLRPVVQFFLPECRKLRAEVAEARKIIVPMLEKRRAEKAEAIQQSQEPKKHNDIMEWMDDLLAGRPYNPVTVQLGVSLAAIHTTSDLLTQVIFDICGRDELIGDLRKEISSVIKEGGWTKTSLYKMKLLDSVMKESQRLKPTSVATMRRIAEQTVTLPDGTQIPKGSPIMVSSHHMWMDEDYYPNAHQFDGYRFYNLRQIPGQENSAQFVTTSESHLGFGHGKHACPGRFFAANESKVALCHMIMKYDFRFVDGDGEKTKRPDVVRNGIQMMANPFAQIAVKRREETEIVDL